MNKKPKEKADFRDDPSLRVKESKTFDPAKEFLGLKMINLDSDEYEEVDYFEVFCQENTIDIYKRIVHEHMKKTYGH